MDSSCTEYVVDADGDATVICYPGPYLTIDLTADTPPDPSLGDVSQDAMALTAHGDLGDGTCTPKLESMGSRSAKPVATFLVSTSALRRYSKYFDKACSPQWTREANQPRRFELTGFDEGSLWVLLNACHGNWWRIPKQMALEDLSELSKVMHFTQIYEPLYFPGEVWRSVLDDCAVFKEYQQVEAVCVSHQFGWDSQFKEATKCLQRDFYIEPKFEIAGLEQTEDAMIKMRQNFSRCLRECLDSCEDLCEDSRHCLQSCRDLHIGRIYRLRKVYFSQDSEMDYDGFWEDIILDIESLPMYCTKHGPEAGYEGKRHPAMNDKCRLRDEIDRQCTGFLADWACRFDGLDLKDFPNRMQIAHSEPREAKKPRLASPFTKAAIT